MIVATASRPRWAWGEALAAWVAARVLVSVGYAAADGIASVLRLDSDATLHLREGLVTWDGRWYRLIAEGGYDAAGREGLRFFPLYPMLARILAWPFGGHSWLLVIIANGAAFAALVLLYRLVEEQWQDPDLASRATWLSAVFPAAGAMVMAYSESLLVVASLVIFLAMRRQRWWIVAAAGLVAGLTRPVGVLLALPVAIEAARRRDRPGSARLAAVVAPGVGLLSYLLWVGGEYGDWLEPVRVQRELRAGFQDPLTRLWDGLVTLGRSQLDAPNLAFAVLLIALVIVAARTQPASWSSYAAVTLVVALSAQNINSIGRYGFVAFPFVVAAAQCTADQRAQGVAMALSAGALVGLTTMSALGVYQP